MSKFWNWIKSFFTSKKEIYTSCKHCPDGNYIIYSLSDNSSYRMKLKDGQPSFIKTGDNDAFMPEVLLQRRQLKNKVINQVIGNTETERLLDFNNEDDMLLFQDWWVEEGRDMYRKFHISQPISTLVNY